LALALAWPWRYACGLGLGLVLCGLVNIPAVSPAGPRAPKGFKTALLFSDIYRPLVSAHDNIFSDMMSPHVFLKQTLQHKQETVDSTELWQSVNWLGTF